MFFKAGLLIYAVVMLVVTLKVQLSIIGGYLYKDPTSISTEIQENYLSLCQGFLKTGVEKLKNVMEYEVNKKIKPISHLVVPNNTNSRSCICL